MTTETEAKEKTPIQLAHEVSRDVELDSIVLKSAHVESDTADGAVKLDKLDSNQQFLSKYEVKPGGKLRVLITFSLSLFEKGDSPRNVLALSAEYLISYTLPADKTYSDESLKHFAELNSTLHLWPYFRELVHTVVARVGLGSLTLKVFRVKAPAKKEEKPAKE